MVMGQIARGMLLASIAGMLCALSINSAYAQENPLPAGFDTPLEEFPRAWQSQLSLPLIPPLPSKPTMPASQQARVSSAAVPTTIVAGRTAGTFSVTDSGSASYAIPLWTPPGVNNLQLPLSLSYNSRRGNGVMGVGWTLEGLSAISRCNRTWSQDGVAQGITLTTSDRFCLDGRQMKLTSGTFGVGGSSYATEIETFSRIVANGSASAPPTSFTVTTKNGLIYDYGLTTDSQIKGGPSSPTRTWALSQIRDRVGNIIKFTYYNDAQTGTTGYTNGTYRVKEIDYPYTSTGQGPFYHVVFTYSSRPTTDVVAGFVAGAKAYEPNELDTIAIQSNSSGTFTPVKTYNLVYLQNTLTNRLRLTSVQECSATNCLAPTTIGYQSGSTGWAGTAVTAVASGSSVVGPISVDLNADGMADLLYPVPATTSTSHWWILFSNGSGFGTPLDTNIVTNNSDKILTGTFTGIGQTQLLLPQSNMWSLVTCNPAPTGCTSPASTGVSVNGEFLATDYDGDGLSDLVAVRFQSQNTGDIVTVRRNQTTPSGALTFATTPYQVWVIPGSGHSAPIQPYGMLASADFNGDGRADIAINVKINNTASLYTLYSNGFSAAATANAALSISQYDTPLFGDVNADGCTDILSQTAVFISKCGGGFAQVASNVFVAQSGQPAPILAADWDNDGRTDILYSFNNNWFVVRSNGDSMASATGAGVSAPTLTSWFTLAPSGDGSVALGYSDANNSYALKYILHAGVGSPPDLATSFTDGFAMAQTPSYAPLTSSVYTKGTGTAATFPQLDYQGPLYVVNQFTATDGTGSNYQTQFHYFGARVDLQGRGFEGFSSIRSYDSRNSLYSFRGFNQSFPTLGLLTSKSLTTSTFANLKVSSYTPSSQVITGLGGYESRYFPFINRSDFSEYEYLGTLNGQLITTESTLYSFGDGFGNPTHVDTTTNDKDPTSPFYGLSWERIVDTTYSNDSTNWCHGMPTSITVQGLVPGQTTQTRTYSNVLDSNAALCRIAQKVIEPTSTNLALTVTTTFGFAAAGCGNVTSQSVVGHNPDGSAMPARTTTLGYGTRCQLPESIQNALSQSSTVGYNYDFGLPSSLTDPNQVSISWTYDDFGRKSVEKRADGTYTGWNYYSCNTPPCWGVNDLRFSVYRDEYGSDNSLAFAEGYYWDGFERLRYDQSTHLNGSLVYDSIAGYDPLGRQVYQYKPVGTGSNGYATFAFDALGRQTNSQLYRDNGSLDRTISRDYAGRSVSVHDARSNVSTYVFDVAGRLRRIVDPSPGSTSSYDYDVFGNLDHISDAIGAVSSATYNLRGFKTQAIDADAGTWNFQGDSLNEMVSYSDPRSHTFGFAYDALGRKTSQSEAEGTSTFTFGTSASLHNIGSLQAISGTGYSESRLYDSIGRLATKAITTDQLYQYDFAYNTIGELDTVKYPTSPAPTGTTATRLVIKYAYNYGRVSGISDVTQSTPAVLWGMTQANDYGSVTAEYLGASSSVVAINTGFRPWTNELTSIQSGTSGATANQQNLTFDWDVNGSLSQRTDVARGLTENFAYDSLNRLSSSVLLGSPNVTVNYGYDASGNITSKSDVTGTFAYDPTHPHRLTSVGSAFTATYDANGNVQTRNGLTLNWASFNLPTSLSATIGSTTFSSQFTYGPQHQRIKQVATYSNGTETTFYAGGLFEKSSATSSSVTYYRHYVPTPSGMNIVVARKSDATVSTSYVLTDHLGSSDAIIDGTAGNVGALLVRESFSPFGQRRTSTWGAGSPTAADYTAISRATRRGFTFQEHLDNIQLVHMNGRVYDPLVGRFLSIDPVIADYGDSQSLNPYSYTRNRPLSASDPSGFEDDLPTVVIQAGQDVGEFAIDGSKSIANWLGNLFGSFWGGANSVPMAATYNSSSAQTGATGTCPGGGASGACGAFAKASPLSATSPDEVTVHGNYLNQLLGTAPEGYRWTYPCCESHDWSLGEVTVSTSRPYLSEQPLGDSLGYLLRGLVGYMENNASHYKCGVNVQCLTFPTWGLPGGVGNLGKAAASADHIVLGLRAGLDQLAAKVGGRTLLKDANWMATLKTAVQTPGTRLTVSVEGFSGEGLYNQVMGAVSRGLGGAPKYTEWEMAQLYQGNRLKDVTFVDGAGEVLPNPF